MRPARPLRFDALESKQLLSTVHHHVAPPTAHAPAHVILDGDLTGTLSGIHLTYSHGQVSGAVESFSGRLRTMGAVKAAYTVDSATDGTTVLGGSIDLTNSKGSVHITFGQNDLTYGSDGKPTARYMVASGTGAYAAATGAGTSTISPSIHGHTVVLHMTLHTTKS
jgi:hypothetical protein